jgi:hypothetical protein
MRKVLIIGFPWPYIGGSKRVIGLASHLSDFGWEPVILTAPLQREGPRDLLIVQTEYRGLLGRSARVLGLNEKSDLGEQLKGRVRGVSPCVKNALRGGFRLFLEIAAFPDEHRGWRRFAVAAAEGIIEHKSIDAMISVWPVTSHVIAGEVKSRVRLPWIADLADLWSDNSAYPYGRLRKWFDTRLERQTLKDADALTTSSWPLAERLSHLHGGRQTSAILIGFDPRIVNYPAAPLEKRFTVSYTGMFYAKKRDPRTFFTALKELIAERRVDPQEMDVRLFGSRQDWIQAQIEESGVSTVVRQCGEVSLEECVRRQRESHVLLQVNWNDPTEKGVFSGKLLDYLAARRPILAAGGSGNDLVVREILRETNAGIYAVSNEEIKRSLERFYQEYKANGSVAYSGDWKEVEKYSNQSMAREFAALLDQISGRGAA